MRCHSSCSGHHQSSFATGPLLHAQSHLPTHSIRPLTNTHKRSNTCSQCLAESSGDRSNTAPTAVQPVFSAGVQISSYSPSQALDAVTGKSFSCTACGKCCSLADDVEVWISSAELDAICSHLGISRHEAAAAYLQPYARVSGWHLLQSKVIDGPWPTDLLPAQQGQQQQRQVCVFLDGASNACSIYPVRPLQCSTYPWWPELMGPGAWAAEQQHVCEGIEHPDAPQLDKWHAAQQLQLATEHTLALEAAKPPGWDPDVELYGGSPSKGMR